MESIEKKIQYSILGQYSTMYEKVIFRSEKVTFSVEHSKSGILFRKNYLKAMKNKISSFYFVI